MAAGSLSNQLLTPDEVAAMLSVKVATLAVWRSVKRYDLPYVRVGRAIRYRLQDVAAFIDSRTVQGLAGVSL